MQKYYRGWLLMLFSAIALHISAQTTMSAIQNSGKLVPFTQQYLQYTETKEGLINFNAILTRSVEKSTYQGQPAWLIIQTYQTNKNINKDSSFCHLQTLAPIAYFTDIKTESYRENVFFAGDAIANNIYFKDSIQQFTRKAADVFNGVMTDDLVSMLPFAAGKEFQLKTVNPGLHYFEYTTRIVVDDKEEITLPDDKKVLCWKLRVYQGAGDSFATHWYSADNHRQLKTRSVFKNGNAFVRVAIAG